MSSEIVQDSWTSIDYTVNTSQTVSRIVKVVGDEVWSGSDNNKLILGLSKLFGQREKVFDSEHTIALSELSENPCGTQFREREFAGIAETSVI